MAQIDPSAAQAIHPNDSQRIQRAIEVYETSGCNITAWYDKHPAHQWSYPTIKIIIVPSQRNILHDKIA